MFRAILDRLFRKPSPAAKLPATAQPVPSESVKPDLQHLPGAICLECEEKLTQADPELRQWFRNIKPRFPTAHVSWSFRDEADQDHCYALGTSPLKWPESLHNRLPSLAIDLFELQADGSALWQTPYFQRIAADPATKIFGVTWGGTFEKGKDPAHFELEKRS
jgi:hypothetical protein